MGKHWPLTVRAELLGQMVDGTSAAAVARRHGISKRLVSEWARLAGMTLAIGVYGGPARPAADRVGAESGKGRRLSVGDRSLIQVGLAHKMSLWKIADLVGMNVSSISREVRTRSMSSRGSTYYDARVAHQTASDDRSRPKLPKLEVNRQLRQVVIDGLNQKFSPEQIAGSLPALFPNREDMRVSHETIYQALYIQGKGALRHELTVVKALRSGRTNRLPQSKLPRRSARPWLEGARLSERPAQVEDRAIPGAWEGDLVVGPGNSGLVTLVERSSRFAMIGRLPGTRDSTTVINVLTQLAQQVPEALMTSLTWDQGAEMAQHALFTVATGCDVFFCDPHSPWQRGSNENLNGLIRDFYPKGTNFNDVTDAEIARMQHLLNIRPRKTLRFRTPAETLDAYINGVALTD